VTWVIEGSRVTHVVGSLPSEAVPVLDTAVGVSVPTIRLHRAVHVVATVDRVVSSSTVRPALLVAVITDLSLTTVCLSSEVAAIEHEVPHHELPLLVSVAGQVDWLSILLQTVPVLPAVEHVRMVSSSQILAADLLFWRSAVWLGSGSVLAVVVALITDWSPITLGLLSIVASHVHSVKHLRVTMLIIRTDEVARLAARNTVPVFPAVELVREVSITHSSAVDLVIRG